MKKYKPTKFKLRTSNYDQDKADFAVGFIECLCHTKGRWAGQPFKLLPWQEQIVRDIFGTAIGRAAAMRILLILGNI